MLASKHQRPKIDKFTFAIIATFCVLAMIVLWTFQTIFSSIIISQEITGLDTESELKVNRLNVDEAYEFVFKKEKKSLFIQE
ncbi:MAG: hypothetical protein N2558_02915 [Patescibacteria group bacterium]|nr:hypothetical protein [Patescibacteria group bacterium]